MGTAISGELAENLELVFVDMNGVPRGKTIKSSTFREENLPHIAAAVLCQSITGAYSNVAMEKYDPKDEDMLLSPQWSTCRSVPWQSDDTSQVIVETIDKAGLAVAFDPRNVLCRVLERYQELGLKPIVAPELEFYLLSPLGRDDHTLVTATGIGGHDEFGGEAFGSDTLSKFRPFINDLNRFCKACDLPLSSLLHEMGPAQIELNVGHGEALAKVDELVQLKRLVKAAAMKHGHHASFMAKPIADLPGSGLHIHCSLIDEAGENRFQLKNGDASDTLRFFIGGLQAYLPHAFALIAPNVNSFKRFVPDSSAPINLEWGYDNRTTGFRVPYGPDSDGRVENRVAGADANPYLVVAATLACGLLGIVEAIEATSPVETDAYDLRPNLPENLADGLRALQANDKLVELFSKPFVDVFVSVKQDELADFSTRVSSWEVSYLGSSL
ncbi:MAG: glutamine synthetase [Pseudomonadales bacterium]|nr:glutamine synthetase [Pseudomonadales bacterium]